MNVPDGEFAICMQSLTFEDIVGYVRKALRIEEAMPNASTPGTQRTQCFPRVRSLQSQKLRRVNPSSFEFSSSIAILRLCAIYSDTNHAMPAD